MTPFLRFCWPTLWGNQVSKTHPHTAKFRAVTNFIEIPSNYNILADSCFWCVFRICVLPERLAKEPCQIVKISECLDLIDGICDFDVKNTPDACEHIPHLFGRAAGPENKI